MYVHITEATCLFLDCKIEEIIGKHLLVFVSEKDKERAQIEFETFLKTQKGDPGVFETILPSEEKKTLRIISNIVDEYIFHSLEDITELKRVEEGLKKNEAELLKTKKFLELINSMLRHDIINDLTVILSAADLHEQGEEGMLNEIKKRAHKSIGFINAIRNIGNLAGTKNLHLCNPYNILQSVCSHYKDIVININDNVKNIDVLADETLYSVFDNIISNAIRHGDAEKIDITITVEKQNVIIEIKNNGKKIEEKILTRIFEQGVKSEITGKSGTGLYVTKENMNRFEGNIEVKNVKDGVSFILKLKKVDIK